MIADFFYFLEDSPDGKIIAVIVAMDSRYVNRAMFFLSLYT